MENLKEVEILLVEDDPNDVELTLIKLSKHELTNKIHVVNDGEEALDYIFATGAYAGRDINDKPKVILLDLRLPKVDGLEILQKIRSDERTRAIPVVVLLSLREELNIVESYKLGVNGYIVKPVDFYKFVNAVSEIGIFQELLNQ